MRIFNIFFLVLVGMATICKFVGLGPWDDEFIFLRYAQNLVDGHGLNFNPALAPSNGITNYMHLLMASAPLAWIMGDRAPFYTPVSSLIPWFLCLIFCGWMLHRSIQFVSFAWVRQWVACLLVLGIVFSMSRHATNGMDTAISCLGGILVAASLSGLVLGGSFRFWSDRWSWCFIFLSYSFRPESLVVPLCVGFVTVAQHRMKNRLGLTIILVALLGCVANIGLTWLYFGDPFPLSMYAKINRIYGDEFYQVYEGQAMSYLGRYLLLSMPIFLACALSFSTKRLRNKAASYLMASLLLSSVLILTWVSTRVVPIMGYHGRLLQPAFAPLFMAALLVVRFSEFDNEDQSIFKRMRLGPALHWVVASLTVVGLLWGGIEVRHFAKQRIQNSIQKFSSFNWPCIHQIRKWMNPSKIAATEIGYLGVTFRSSTILDLAGLVTREATQPGFDAADFVEREVPELIYFPHPDYRAMNTSLDQSEFVQRNYTIYSPPREFGILRLAVLNSAPGASEAIKLIQQLQMEPRICN